MRKSPLQTLLRRPCCSFQPTPRRSLRICSEAGRECQHLLHFKFSDSKFYLDMDLVWFQEGLNASATTAVAELLHDPDQGGFKIEGGTDFRIGSTIDTFQAAPAQRCPWCRSHHPWKRMVHSSYSPWEAGFYSPCQHDQMV